MIQWNAVLPHWSLPTMWQFRELSSVTYILSTIRYDNTNRRRRRSWEMDNLEEFFLSLIWSRFACHFGWNKSEIPRTWEAKKRSFPQNSTSAKKFTYYKCLHRKRTVRIAISFSLVFSPSLSHFCCCYCSVSHSLLYVSLTNDFWLEIFAIFSAIKRFVCAHLFAIHTVFVFFAFFSAISRHFFDGGCVVKRRIHRGKNCWMRIYGYTSKY